MALDRKADDIVTMDMSKRSSLCDTFIIMSAPSTTRVKAIGEHINDSMKKEGFPARCREGFQDAMWILLDYGDIVVHVFYQDLRKFYDLENLWGDAPKHSFSHSK